MTDDFMQYDREHAIREAHEAELAELVLAVAMGLPILEYDPIDLNSNPVEYGTLIQRKTEFGVPYDWATDPALNTPKAKFHRGYLPWLLFGAFITLPLVVLR